MDEYVSAAILRLNESIAFRRVEPFHSASSHHGLLCPHKRNRGRTTIVRSPIRSQRCLEEGTPGAARQNKAKLEYRDCTRFSQGVQKCHVIADKSRTPLDNPTNKAQPQPSPAIIRNDTGATGAGGRETDRAPACNHRSVTCGQPYSAWRWPRPSVSAWQPLLWHTANIWHD